MATVRRALIVGAAAILCGLCIVSAFYGMRVGRVLGYVGLSWSLISLFARAAAQEKAPLVFVESVIVGAFVLFHVLGYASQWIIGSHVKWYAGDMVDSAFSIACTYMLAWQLGIWLTESRGKELVRPESYMQARTFQTSCMAVAAIGVSLMVAYYGSLGGIGTVLMQNYEASQWSTSAELNRSTMLLGWGMLGARIGLTGAVVSALLMEKRVNPWRPVWLLYVAYGLLLLIIGDRSGLTLHLLAPVLVYHYARKPIKAIWIVGSIAVLLYSFAVIKEYRHAKGEYGLVKAVGIGAIAADFEKTAKEAGGTLDVVVRGMVLVEKDGYLWGRSFIDATKRVLPNVAGSPRSYFGTATWITSSTAPSTYKVGGGLGSSLVLESVVNWSPIGGALFMIILGCVSGLVCSRCLSSKHSYKLAFGVLYVCQVANSVRNEIGNLGRPLVYGYLFYFIATQVLYTLLNRRKAGRDA